MAGSALPEVIYGDDNDVMFDPDAGTGQVRCVTAEPVCTGSFQLTGLTLKESQSYPQISGDPGDYIGYSIGDNNSITFEIHSAPDGSRLPSGFYDWWFEPRIIGNVTFNGVEGDGYIHVIADLTNSEELYAEFSPSEINFSVEPGFLGTLEETINVNARYYSDNRYANTAFISAYTTELVSAMSPEGANLSGTDPMQFINVIQTADGQLNVCITPGNMLQGTYVWRLSTIVTGDYTTCDSDDVYITVNVTGYASADDIYIEYEPQGFYAKIEEGYSRMTPQKINVKGTTNAGVVALVKVEDVDVSDAGFGEVDYSDHIVCTVSNEGDVIEISALPGIPAGEYIFYIFPTVTHMGTPVSTSEFSISLDVAEFDEDGIAGVNLDPYEIYIETEEGVQSPLSEPIKLTAYTKEQTVVDVDWLGADFAWDEAEGERDYREYLEPVVNGDEISFRLLPGIPAGQYSWTLMPVLNTDRDYSVDEFNVTAYVAPRQGPQPVTITGLRYANGAVTIAWAESPGAEGYKVYRRVDGGSWTTIKKNTTETTFTDTNVTPGTKYYYVVRSHIGGVYSGGVSETTKSITIPAEPQPVTIT
ncbi:MAG: hypothetical protein IIY34_06460, partial [Clostridia bacterium]|nr:hypothetical protein [Clostridia bacterium]